MKTNFSNIMIKRENIKSEFQSMRKRSSLKNIADKHGVSLSHVSNVLAGRRHNDKIMKSLKSLISKGK